MHTMHSSSFCFVMAIYNQFLVDMYEVFTLIIQGCFIETEAIVKQSWIN